VLLPGTCTESPLEATLRHEPGLRHSNVGWTDVPGGGPSTKETEFTR